MKNDRLILDYAPPPERRNWQRLGSAVGGRLLLALGLFGAAVLVPHPEGIWYLAYPPRWLIAIEVQGLEIGPSSDPRELGWMPLLVLKMLLVGLPIWLIRRRRRMP